MLEKLDFILILVRDCNFTLKRIVSRGESRLISSVPSGDVRESEVDETEAESEIVDEPEPDPEVDEPPELEVEVSY